MDEPAQYEIRVEGHLTQRWSEWFEGLEIHNESGDVTRLQGWFIDQSALFGTLSKIHGLNLTLISVVRITE